MTNRQTAIDLIHGLVSIPSLSTKEAAAAAWLSEQMTALGYDRAYVDEAGNAVGEMGESDAVRTIVLLGHIDTVPGNIPVRIENSSGDELLFGRGSVDAKGPLATFAAAVSRVGAQFARDYNIRIVMVGSWRRRQPAARARAILPAVSMASMSPFPPPASSASLAVGGG
ncbi:MAG: M20/M25/M40 family metallo-hydrolase [Caldilineaceae bacterium]